MSATDVMSSLYDYSVSSTQKKAEEEKANVNSGKVSHSDFLKLLVTQLTTQDPLNPMQDIDFTAQLAQLQALDEQVAMTKSMAAMRQDSQLQAASAMIGKYVSGTDKNGASALGLVSRVVQSDGEVNVELSNKQLVPVGSIGNIWNESSSIYDQLSLSGNVIGMWVDAGTDSASQQPIEGIIEKVVVENGRVMLKLYGGKTVDWNQVKELRTPTDDEMWYVLPDDVRNSVEEARKKLGKVITGRTDDGETVTGIVSNAELDGSDVYLLLYNGKRVKASTVTEAARDPEAADVERDMTGLWVTGLDSDAQSVSGLVAGAEGREDGIVLKLSDGREVYFDTLSDVRKPTDEELAGTGGSEGEP